MTRGQRNRAAVEAALVELTRGRRFYRPPWFDVDACLRRAGIKLSGRSIRLYVQELCETPLLEEDRKSLP